MILYISVVVKHHEKQYLSKQTNKYRTSFRNRKNGCLLNLVGSQGGRKKGKYIQKGAILLVWKTYLFPVIVGDSDKFNSPSNFLESLEVSRDRGQESAFIP